MRQAPSGKNLVLLLCTLCACGEPFDARVDRASLSAGEAIYEVLCHRVAADDLPRDVDGSQSRASCRHGELPPPAASPRWLALHEQRARIIGAIDQTLGHGRASALETLLGDALPLFDSGTIQAPSRQVAALLNRFADAPTSLDAFARLSARDGYRPARLALGVVKPILAYPRLDALLDGWIRTLGSDGTARVEFEQLLRAIQAAFENWQSAPDESPSTLALLRELLWHADPQLDDGVARYVALRDPRGVVEVDDALGGMPQPFADLDGDGLADVNRNGLFIDAVGRELNSAAPFALPWAEVGAARDGHGRLLGSDGTLVYRYLDVTPTLLAASIRAGHELLASRPTALMDLLVPSVRLLGDPMVRKHVYPSGHTWQYRGFAVQQSPMVDLVRGVAPVATRQSARRGIGLARELLNRDETAVAALSDLLVDLTRWRTEPVLADAHLEVGATFGEQMFELQVEMARVPGLLEDLFAAIRRPEVSALGSLYSAYLRNKDRIDFDPNEVNGPPIGSPMTAVDRSKPDAGGNRSIFQRLMHMIHDTRGGRMCNKAGAVLDLGIVRYPEVGSYAECELLEIPDMFEFYVRAIIGEARLEFKDPTIDFAADFDLLLEQMSGIDGLTRNPTPEAINRLVFAPMNAFSAALVDQPRTADGVLFTDRHSGTIFAFEIPGQFEGMAPIIRAFEKHGRLDLFGQMMSTQHLHWGSPQNDTTQSHDPTATAFAYNGGVVRFEELVARTFGQGQFFSRLARLIDTISGIEVEGMAGDEVLAELVRDMMLPERHSLEVHGVAASPMEIIIDALDDMEARLHAEPGDVARLDAAKNRLMEQLLRAGGAAGSETFANRTTAALLASGLELIERRLHAHRQLGDLDHWAAGLADSLVETLGEPVIASAALMLQAVARDAALRAEVDQFLAHFTGSEHSVAFDVVVVAAADLLQLLEDDDTLVPLLTTFAPELNPNGGLVLSGEKLLRQLHGLDWQRGLAGVMGALVEPHATGRGESVVEALVHAAVQINRAEPGRRAALSSDDYSGLLTRLADFLTDEEHGIERLYALIAER